jgi:hypothetical protein
MHIQVLTPHPATTGTYTTTTHHLTETHSTPHHTSPHQGAPHHVTPCMPNDTYVRSMVLSLLLFLLSCCLLVVVQLSRYRMWPWSPLRWWPWPYTHKEETTTMRSFIAEQCSRSCDQGRLSAGGRGRCEGGGGEVRGCTHN